MVEPAPGAVGQAIGPLQAGNAGFDAGPEVSELAIHPAAPDHIFDPEAAALLMEGHIAHTPGLGLGYVFTARIAAVGARLPRRLAIEGCGAPVRAKAARCRPDCRLR